MTSLAYDDHTALLWAILAMARLDSAFPSLEEAKRFRSIPAKSDVLRLRYAFDKMTRIFCSYDMDASWSDFPIEDAEKLFYDIHKGAFYFYFGTAEGRNRIHADYLHTYDLLDTMIDLLDELFEYVSMKKEQEQPDADGRVPLFRTIEERLARILQRDTASLFEAFNRLLPITQNNQDAFEGNILLLLDTFHNNIQDYIHLQFDLMVLSGQVPDMDFTLIFTDLIDNRVRAHVKSYFDQLLDDLDLENRWVIDWQDAQIKDRVRVFYKHVARLFFYASPLLNRPVTEELTDEAIENAIQAAVEDEPEGGYLDEPQNEFSDHSSSHQSDDTHSGEVVPEHVERHDFDEYRDDDWYIGECLLFDVQDVLIGPEHVTIDQVSTVTLDPVDPFCVICRDFDVEIRKLIACMHEFCSTCLESQLGTEHECRYRCGICRSEFFPEETTEDSII